MSRNIFFMPPTEEEVLLAIRKVTTATLESQTSLDVTQAQEKAIALLDYSSFEYYTALHNPKHKTPCPTVSLSQLRGAGLDMKRAREILSVQFNIQNAGYFASKANLEPTFELPEEHRRWFSKMVDHDIGTCNLARRLVILQELASSIVLDLTWFNLPYRRSGDYSNKIFELILDEISNIQSHPLVAGWQRNAQVRIAHQSGAYYQAVERKDSIAKAWCCISGSWYNEADTVVKPIIEYNVGEHNARYLLGEPDFGRGHLLDVGNCVTVHRDYEEELRMGRIALVPVARSDDLVVVVLQQEKGHRIGLLDGLDGRKLSFRNQNRPKTQLMYFQFCAAIFMGQRCSPPGWWKRFSPYLKVFLYIASYLGTPLLIHPEVLYVMGSRIAGMSLEEMNDAFCAPFTKALNSLALGREQIISDTVFVSMTQQTITPARVDMSDLDV